MINFAAVSTLSEYTRTISILAVLVVGFVLVQRVLLLRLENLFKKTKNDFDDEILRLIRSIKLSFFLVLSTLIALSTLSLDERAARVITLSIVLLVIYQAVRSSSMFFDYIGDKLQKRNQDEGSSQAIKFLTQFGKGSLWVLGILLFTQNIGVNITSLIAGLGIGGVAVALAAQNILGDLFSSFAIIFDKPFVPGDFIIVGDKMGVVEKIGIKTTRIRALRGEELILSNNDLTSQTIQNFKKMRERRVEFHIGVTYKTNTKKLKVVPNIIEDVIKSIKLTRFDRANLSELGDFAKIFEVVYYINSSDYNTYMDIQQKVLLEIDSEFAKKKIDFAYPTQSVILKKD
jgi:small-conductance mechanosensitive channel